MTTMNRRVMTVVAATTLLACTAVVPALAQGTQDKPAPPPTVPARVEVVISRFQGDKKLASQPYILMPTANPSGDAYGNLRIGVDVPVGTTTTTRPPEGTREGVTTTKPAYQNVGTNIDCQVRSQSGGLFAVMVSVTDSSIFNPDSPSTMGRPSETAAIRTFTARNTLTMRDGQTMLLIAATDKVSGELIKIEVTFSVVK
jgi:hypothetical protein